MNKKLKRSFLAAGIVVGVCALVWGGLTLLRNGSRSTVKVYPVTGISMLSDCRIRDLSDAP